MRSSFAGAPGKMGSHCKHVALFDDIAQLPHITRPAVFAETDVVFPGSVPRAAGHSERHTFWRKSSQNLGYLQLVRECEASVIPPNSSDNRGLRGIALFHVSFEIAIGGGDDLDVDFHRMRRPNGGHFTFLQDPQQLRLQFQRHVTDFVKKNHASLAGTENAEAFACRPSKCPLFVAEKLAFGKRGGESCAIDRQKGLVVTWTDAVQQPGPKLLCPYRFHR